MKSFLSSVRFTRPSGPLSRQIIITLGMFVLGAVFGFLARFLDIHTQNLGNIFSQMSVWVFLGTVIAVLSPSPLRAGINVFVFCAGMLIVYYTYAHLSGGVYSMTFVKATNRHVRETSSDKGLFFPSYTHFIYTNHSE